MASTSTSRTAKGTKWLISSITADFGRSPNDTVHKQLFDPRQFDELRPNTRASISRELLDLEVQVGDPGFTARDHSFKEKRDSGANSGCGSVETHMIAYYSSSSLKMIRQSPIENSYGRAMRLIERLPRAPRIMASE